MSAIAPLIEPFDRFAALLAAARDVGPERLPEPRRAQKKRRASAPRKPKPERPKGDGPRRGSVPKVPLVRV